MNTNAVGIVSEMWKPQCELNKTKKQTKNSEIVYSCEEICTCQDMA